MFWCQCIRWHLLMVSMCARHAQYPVKAGPLATRDMKSRMSLCRPALSMRTWKWPRTGHRYRGFHRLGFKPWSVRSIPVLQSPRMKTVCRSTATKLGQRLPLESRRACKHLCAVRRNCVLLRRLPRLPISSALLRNEQIHNGPILRRQLRSAKYRRLCLRNAL